MNLFYALLLGIIEGLTEFIPVSSTAHMLIVQRIFNIPSDAGMFAFLVLVQLGPLAKPFGQEQQNRCGKQPYGGFQ